MSPTTTISADARTAISEFRCEAANAARLMKGRVSGKTANPKSRKTGKPNAIEACLDFVDDMLDNVCHPGQGNKHDHAWAVIPSQRIGGRDPFPS